MKPGQMLSGLVIALMLVPMSYAQQEPSLPARLTEAGYCMVASPQNWLGIANSPAQIGHFSWVEDDKSSPGERHLYLMARVDGGPATLFDLRMEWRHGKHIFTVENRFDLRGGAMAEELVSVPPGGPRTLKLYQGAIRKLHRRVSYEVRLGRLRQQVPNLVCSSEIGD